MNLIQTTMTPILCHNKIELGNQGIAVTYCYLPKGHEGKCDPNPPKEVKNGVNNK